MSHLSSPVFGITFPVILLGFLLPSVPKEARADQPAGVQRTFAVEVAGGTPLDFLSEASLRVVVAPADPLAPQSFIRFADTNSDERFDSTVWEHQHAMHITTDGAQIPGFVVWLLTAETPAPPPSGALTFTGPESPAILSQEVVYIKACTAITCGADWDGKYHVATANSYDGKLIVVSAMFSR